MTRPANQALHRVAIARIVTVLLATLLMHWVSQLHLFYFALLGVIATLLLLSYFPALPKLPGLHAIRRSDRLAVWIVLAVLAILGYLHNANSWIADGAFNRPTDIALWKSELVLSIALAAPLVRWIATALVPNWRETGGSYFAREFALYVNFSGVAVLLWTGQASLSLTLLAAIGALIVLAELTLHAGG